MNITVRVFASYADTLGSDHVVVPVPDPATVGDVRLGVARLSPELPQRPIIAVNGTYSTDDMPVVAGDEVAAIPPVAGG